MVYIKTDSNNIVTYQHHMPFDDIYGMGKTKDKLLEDGYLVDSIPKSEGDGCPILKYNNGIVEIIGYESVNAYKTPNELLRDEIKTLQKDNAQTQYALMMGGLV
ncbi:hypothetical protein ACER0A_002265 [Haloimpatiens sp. FM7315]|uniref:hypothetical protein n=1 Tax=Haloimpatiens sp. FM7315 TaxID=3298609 RepID=UPI0035A3456F